MKPVQILLLFLFLPTLLVAQSPDPTRFAEEIIEIQKRNTPLDDTKPVVVFTGSSSVRMWKDVQNYFPEVNALNNGFGGSHFTDLIHYQKELMYDFNPDKLFIYEGDNDTGAGIPSSEILAATAYLYAEIRQNLPDTEIYFITPKPSIARWELQAEYEEFNAMLEDFCSFDDNVYFVDVWTPMLDENGVVRDDLFIEDNLHMNKTGYDIWGSVIGEFLK